MTDGLPNRDSDIEITFGKFKGTPLGEVPAWYLSFMGKQEYIGKWPAVQQYIKDNLEIIEKEAEEQGINK